MVSWCSNTCVVLLALLLLYFIEHSPALTHPSRQPFKDAKAVFTYNAAYRSMPFVIGVLQRIGSVVSLFQQIQYSRGEGCKNTSLAFVQNIIQQL